MSGNKYSYNENNIWKRGNIDYLTYSDDMSEEDYSQWQINFLNECHRVLKSDGSLFYNHKVRRHDSKAHFPQWVFNSNLNFYQMIMWDRCCNHDPNCHYLFPNTEIIFWLTKDKPKVFKDKCIFNNEIWKINPSHSQAHPASFPEEIPLNCILLTTSEHDIVLDPFMGSGTTGIVSKRLNRSFIGIEIDENYFNLSKQKIDSTFYNSSFDITDSIESQFVISRSDYKKSDFIV